MDSISKLAEIIKNSERIVFFGGAGVSTESGIPDFRSVDGIYNMNYKYPPELMVSIDFLESNPEEFFKFYREKLLYPDAKPNFAHEYLAKLEKDGKLSAVITQNVDGLHQAASSKNVIELHGSAHVNYCKNCNKLYYGVECMMTQMPLCACGGIIRPDVVLYGEALKPEIIKKAIEEISSCDTLIIGGTGLAVYPAASFIDYFKGKNLVIINKSEIAKHATLVIREAIGETFSLVERMIN